MSEFLNAVQNAQSEMRRLFPATPLLRNDYLSGLYGADIWLKREDLSPVRSYKIRGAFNAMRKALAADREQSLFVCASAGNHAQGVAYNCRHFGVRGVIFMPVTTPRQKIGKTTAFGGDNVEVILTGDYFDDTLAAAQAYAAEKGGRFLPPFDDTDVIEGQASVGLEILEGMTGAIDLVVLPVGGGGLSAGITRLFQERAPETGLRYVEPAGGASLTAAIAAGQPVTLPRVDNFVDGAAVARIGSLNFEVLQHVDQHHVMTVPEDRICLSIVDLLNIEGIVLEPAGAMSVNLLEDIRDEIAGKTVVCVTSGGNFDFERLPEVKERALRYSGLKKYFVLRLPQRPGALKEFLNLLGPDDDIARFEYLKKSARNFGSVLIGIESKETAAIDRLFARMHDAGFVFQDITDDETLAAFLI